MNDGSYRVIVRYPVLLAIASLLVMGVFAKRGFLDYQRMAAKNREMKTRIDELWRNKEGLALQIASMRDSTDEQERWIRSVLGFVRKGETVIEFD